MVKITQIVKEITIKIVGVVQKVLIKVLLVLTYYIGFGITYVFVFLFNRKLLRSNNKNEDTFWKDAKGYNQDMDECIRQS